MVGLRLLQYLPEVLSSNVNRPNSVAEDPPLSIVDLRKEWSYISAPPRLE
jgi:hypothetical protein